MTAHHKYIKPHGQPLPIHYVVKSSGGFRIATDRPIDGVWLFRGTRPACINWTAKELEGGEPAFKQHALMILLIGLVMFGSQIAL